MTYEIWNNAAEGDRELYVKDTGWSWRTRRSMIKKRGEQLSSAARLVINYTLTGKREDWN